MDFAALLKFAVDHDASDVHVQAGLPPNVRIGGILKATTLPAITEEQIKQFIMSMAPKRDQ